MSTVIDYSSSLGVLRRQLPGAAQELKLDLGPSMQAWQEALDRKLLPRMDTDFPLVAAICGGGSAGKSTLFNSLVKKAISPTGGRAGINRRVLVALNTRHLPSTGLMTALGYSFKEDWGPLESPDQLTSPGRVLYWAGPNVPEQLVLLDTPDIDTGSAGLYTNREAAQQSLEAADLLIYIFTNATYNNRDNTDFVSELLNAVGTRPCYLIYRVYPSFDDEEIRDHARTVADNLYGSDYGEHMLGVFRADEDNAVAAGEKAIQVRSVETPGLDLAAALSSLDTGALRSKVLASVYSDTLRQAEQMIHRIRQDQVELKRYIDLLTAAQQHCVRQALSHFPTDRVLGRFAEIWLDSDPAHIKWMRRTGRIVEWPYRLVSKVVRRIRDANASLAAPPESADRLNDRLEMDLLEAANRLYQAALDAAVQSDGRSVQAHPAVQATQEKLRQKDWQEVLSHIAAQKKKLLGWSDQLESELKELAEDLRGRMGLFAQVRETFAALLNVIPATAAVTYILHTGDPVGAAGIKVKLTGLFGLQDLYALIAIPVTSGLKQADRKQLERLLSPVAGAWLANKLQEVQSLFEEQISGELLEQARSAYARADEALIQSEQALAACKEDREW